VTSPLPPNRAVLDRIVDGRVAVLLVGDDQTELRVPTDVMPADATEGDWLIIDSRGRPAAVDTALTTERRKAARSRLERIRRRQTGGRFGA
jgi:hypothetical protein